MAEEIVKFNTIEAALTETYGTPDDAIPSFRARLRFLQKHGLHGPLPGRGVALHYHADRMHRFIFACEALAFGFAPSVVLDLAKELWECRLRRIFERAEEARAAKPDPGSEGQNTGDDIVMHVGGAHLLGDLWWQRVPNVNAHKLREMPSHVQTWLAMLPNDPSGLQPRMLATNLTMRLRVFYAALERANQAELRAEYVKRMERTGKLQNSRADEVAKRRSRARKRKRK